MKRAALLVSAALLSGALVTPALAQVSAPPVAGAKSATTEYGENHPYAQHFDSFFDSHPKVAKQLGQNPSLIDNAQYLQQHPGLQEYVQKHPKAADAFKDHPYAFMHREHRYEGSEHHRWRRHRWGFRRRHTANASKP